MAGTAAQLESIGFWQSHDRLKIIRLLGCQPVQANEDIRVAQIFLACHALKPVAETAFDDLLSDMESDRRDKYRKGLMMRWPDLFRARQEGEWRQMLFDLADRNIERLDAKREVHQENADVVAERTFARLSFDPSPEGEALRNYLLKCTNGLHRGMASYRKCQAKTTEAWRSAGDLGRRPTGPDGANNRGWRAQEDDRSEPGADGSARPTDGQESRLEWADDLRDRAAQPPSSTAVPGDTDPSAIGLMADATVSDGVVDLDATVTSVGANLADDRPVAKGSDLGHGANAIEGTCHRSGDAVDVENHQDDTCEPAGICGDATNEANSDAAMSITQVEYPVEVTSYYEAVSGLDKGVAHPEEVSVQEQADADESRSDRGNPGSEGPNLGDRPSSGPLLAPFSKREDRRMRREESARKAEIILGNKLRKGTITLRQILDYAMQLAPQGGRGP